MYSIHSLASDHCSLIATELAKEPSKVTVYVPSIRSWGSTNKQFRAILRDDWLAPAAVCKFKFSQAVQFNCPALRVLDVADHFAEVLPLDAFQSSIKEVKDKKAEKGAFPKNAALPMMLVNRAGARLQPETKTALLQSASKSIYALPSGEGLREGSDAGKDDWSFTKADGKNLARLIEDCFGVADGGDMSIVFSNGKRYFADDCLAVIHQLPAGLKALAFQELALCLEHLTEAPVKGAANAVLEILFEIEHLIPVQWHQGLVDGTVFRKRDFDQCANLVLASANANPAIVAAICIRLVKLLASFLVGLPEGRRHWTKVAKGRSAEEMKVFKSVLNLVHGNMHNPAVYRAYKKEIFSRGFITREELKNPKVMGKFKAWITVPFDMDALIKAYSRQQQINASQI